MPQTSQQLSDGDDPAERNCLKCQMLLNTADMPQFLTPPWSQESRPLSAFSLIILGGLRREAVHLHISADVFARGFSMRPQAVSAEVLQPAVGQQPGTLQLARSSLLTHALCEWAPCCATEVHTAAACLLHLESQAPPGSMMAPAIREIRLSQMKRYRTYCRR